MLRHAEFLHGRSNPIADVADIAWFDESGAIISAEAWNDISQRTLILRRSMRIPEGKVTILSLLLNADDKSADFRLPPPHAATRLLLDSAEPDAGERPLTRHEIRVAAHSAILLCAEHPA